MTTDIDTLAGILRATTGLVAGVRPDQRSLPTPCEEYDVRVLLNHIVGWSQVFALAAAEGPGAGQDAPRPDPAAYEIGDDPGAEFGEAADRALAGWRRFGTDRTVRFMGEIPGRMAFGMMEMEYVVHGVDLAVATGQDVPYTDDQAEAALAAARGMLAPEYRGDGKMFAPEVTVPAGAPAIDRLLGFAGRRPLA